MNAPTDHVHSKPDFDALPSAAQRAAVKRACLNILATRHPGAHWIIVDRDGSPDLGAPAARN
jgi:hypothetical protein